MVTSLPTSENDCICTTGSNLEESKSKQVDEFAIMKSVTNEDPLYKLGGLTEKGTCVLQPSLPEQH